MQPIAMKIVLVSLCLRAGNAANILGIFTTTTKSHLIIHLATIQALVDRGHNVTVITTLPLEGVGNSGFHHIHVPATEEDITEYRRRISAAASTTSGLDSIRHLLSANIKRVEIQDQALRHPRFQELLNNKGNHFDLVILGLIFNSFQLGVAAHFKCPAIVSWVNVPPNSVMSLVGNPVTMSSGMYKDSGEFPGFEQRLKYFFENILFTTIELFAEYKMEQYYREHFPAERYPSYDEVKRNISLVFCATHFSEGLVRPMVPAFIEIGGIQVKEKPDRLPKDIGKFLKDADDGFIFFSLGTNAKSSDMSPNTTSTIFKVLSKTKQKILWKWDGAAKPGRASNIMFRKWFPQNDIIAHPKLRLFITHAGRGSTVEAQFHGVPMLAMPMFGDQFQISHRIQALGHGLVVSPRNLSEAIFEERLREILTNTTYARTAWEFALLYRDRPITAKQSVVFWTEYIIRHKGARHMQSLAVHMNFFQRNSLDVIGVVLMVLLVPLVIIVLLIMLCLLKRKVKTD